MKSYELYVHGLYESVIEDILVKYPGYRKGLGRDLSRLYSCVEQSGLSFYTIVLPSQGKHFDKALASGRLFPSGLPFQRPYKKAGVIPRLFKELYLRVFNDLGILRVDADVQAIRFLRQLFYLTKKIELECTDGRTFRAIEEFFTVDRQCRRGSLNWDLDDLGIERATKLSFTDLCDPEGDTEALLPLSQELEVTVPSTRRSELDTLQKVFDIISSTLGLFDPYEWKAKHGPGAVSDAKQGRSKYDFPNWPQKLENVFPMSDFAFASYEHWVDALQQGYEGRFSLNEPPSKLISVPKTQKAPRLIASEPVSHQWCQQIIKNYLADRVTTSWMGKSIHFRDQTFNQQAALIASRTGDSQTIDLSMASDRMTTYVVERAFRKNKLLLAALHATRTRWITNDIDKKSPNAHKLIKFSCMGSACTFPIQSIVFLGVALTALCITEKVRPTIKSLSALAGSVRVFGDDIIIPLDEGKCQEILSYLGFEINRSKTFDTGRFRESCGMDAYEGHDVTPVYVRTAPNKAKPESIISCVEVHNNAVRRRWYNLAGRMKSTVTRTTPHLRIAELPVDSGDFGWKLPSVFHESTFKQRFNHRLHRWERLVHTIKTRVTRLPDRGGSRLLQYFTEAPDPSLRWESGIVSRPKTSLSLRWVPMPI